MKVNEMVFFDRLRLIHQRLHDAYMHVYGSTYAQLKTIADHKSYINTLWDAMEAVKEAEDDLDLLLSLTMEDPQHTALQGQHNLKKPELYSLLGINRPMPRAPVGVAKAYPVVAEKKGKEAEA